MLMSLPICCCDRHPSNGHQGSDRTATSNTLLSQVTTNLLVGLPIICCDRQLANGHQGGHELPHEGVVKRIWCHACKTAESLTSQSCRAKAWCWVYDIMLIKFGYACLTHNM